MFLCPAPYLFLLSLIWYDTLNGNEVISHSNIVSNYHKKNLSLTYFSKNKHWKVIKPKIICFYLFDKNINPKIMIDLCTHINIGFFEIDKKTHSLENSTEKFEILQKTILLKNESTPKILVSVGGAGSSGFSPMIKNHNTRKIFIKSVMKILKNYMIDGVDLDWEWPVLNGDMKEKIKFVQLLYELRQEFNKHKNNYILSIDVSPLRSIIELAYKVPYLAEYVDFINIMCYDYHFYTKWFPLTGHNAPLYSDCQQCIFGSFNVNYSIYYWITKAMPKDKIILGIPTYGHTYELSSPKLLGLNAPAKGEGLIGLNGYASYLQICQYITQKSVAVVFDSTAKVPYASKYPDWVSYDNEISLAYKADYAVREGLTGVMIFSINSDDYTGHCSQDKKPLPLLRKIRSVLLNEV